VLEFVHYDADFFGIPGAASHIEADGDGLFAAFDLGHQGFGSLPE